ncbi:MAG: ATP-dependent Clp protease adaptor ClpS [Dehalococcoidia bacterium]
MSDPRRPPGHLPPLLTTEPSPSPGRTVTAEPAGETDVQPAGLWHLVLFDDNEHTYEYVIEMLARLFGYAREKAFALARIVDTHGRVTLMTGERAACEAKQSQIHAYGADPRIPTSKGPMSAVVEQVDAPSR